MSEIVPLKDRVNSVNALIQSDGFLAQLKMALPRTGVTAERMARVVMTEVRRVPKLAQCNQYSLLGAVMTCAQLGLEPGPMGLAYIIPYKDEAQFQIGYKGLLNLIWRSEQIASVQAEVVYEKDHFDYANGIPPRLEHRPASGDRGQPTHAYAVIGTTAGGWIFRVMTVHEIEQIRTKYSKAKRDDSPWKTSWDEMACKTVLKRTCKRAPVSTEVQQAINLDDRSELGINQDLDAIPLDPSEFSSAETPADGEPNAPETPAEGWPNAPESPVGGGEANPSQSPAPPPASAPSPDAPPDPERTDGEDAGASEPAPKPTAPAAPGDIGELF